MAKIKSSPLLSGLEKVNRIRQVAEFILQGYSRADIIRNICSVFDIKERQAARYYAWAEEYLIDNSTKEFKLVRAEHIMARKSDLVAMLKVRNELINNKKYSEAAKIQKEVLQLRQDIAKIEGLYVEKIQPVDGEGNTLSSTVVNFIVKEKK